MSVYLTVNFTLMKDQIKILKLNWLQAEFNVLTQVNKTFF